MRLTIVPLLLWLWVAAMRLLPYYLESGISFPAQGNPQAVTLYLACYYLNIAAANEDRGGTACYFYDGQFLKALNEHVHNGHLRIPGFDLVPALFFWMRKLCDLG